MDGWIDGWTVGCILSYDCFLTISKISIISDRFEHTYVNEKNTRLPYPGSKQNTVSFEAQSGNVGSRKEIQCFNKLKFVMSRNLHLV